MKEYFQKIVAWAKANPWLAAGILGGILLIVYLAVKNGWLGGGGGGGSASALGPDDDGGEATLPDLTDLPDTSGIGQSSNPIPVSIPTNQPSSFGGLPDMSAVLPGLEDAGYYDPGYIDNGSIFTGAPVVSVASQSLAEVSSPAPLAAIGAGFFSGSLDYGSTSQDLPTKIVSASAVAAPAASESKKSSSNKSLNPAQQKGKGKKFTGYIDGVYYSNGYPAAPSSLAVQSKSSSSGQASGGNFFSGQYADPLPASKPKQKNTLNKR